MSNPRSQKVATLATNDPTKFLEVKVAYDDSCNRKNHYLSVTPIIDKGDGFISHIIGLGSRESVVIPNSVSPRFSAKKLENFAANWLSVPGLAELVLENAKNHKAELTAESKKLVGIVENSPPLVSSENSTQSQV